MTDKQNIKFSKKTKKQDEIREKWIQRQMTGFLYWVNSYLAKEEVKIDNLLTGFSDGVLLIKFLELLTGQTITQRYTKNPTLRVHKITNCYLALQLLDSVRGLTISSEDLVDGHNVPAILGFCWQLLRQFQDTKSLDHDAEDEQVGKKPSSNSFEARLLEWVRQLLQPKGIEIENWKSFQDGRALLTLLSLYDSSIIDLDSWDMSDPLRNCQTALDLANSKIGIPSELLEAEEIVDGSVSEKNMALYLTLFYNAFKERDNLMSKDKLIEMVMNLEESISLTKKEISDLELSHIQLEEELEEKNRSVEEHKRQVADLEQWKEDQQKSWDDEKAEILKEISELESKIESLKLKSDGKVSELQRQSEEILREKNHLVTEIDAIELEIKNLKKDIVLTHKKAKKEEQATENLSAYYDESIALRDHGSNVIRKFSLAHYTDINRWYDFLSVNDGDVKETVDGMLDESKLQEMKFEKQFEKINAFVKQQNELLGERLKTKVEGSVKEETEQKQQKVVERKKRKARPTNQAIEEEQ